MYKIRLSCEVPETIETLQDAVDITDEFTHRPWQQKAVCTWDGSRLVLDLVNDFDDNGLASMDEFSDAVVACTRNGTYRDMRVERVITSE